MTITEAIAHLGSAVIIVIGFLILNYRLARKLSRTSVDLMRATAELRVAEDRLARLERDEP